MRYWTGTGDRQCPDTEGAHNGAVLDRQQRVRWGRKMPASDHADFWVVVGTVAPVTIVADVVLIGQSIPLGPYLKRREGETTWTSRLREYHLHFIGIDLALCLAVIGLSMNVLWTGVGSVAEAWTATVLLLIVLVTLCILAVCTAIIDRNKHKYQGWHGDA